MSDKHEIELLAPAGNFDALKSAIANGANAVYCGLNKYSARAKATNFDLEQIKKAIDYAHLFNVKIYVAMNTLLYQNELKPALDLARQLHDFNVDALIVQDLGFVALLKKELPNLILHASTQMGIHNLEGAIAAKKLGLERIILSRETTLQDIKNIKANCDIELEFFCHGALCAGFSGNCYLCSILMKQSGNRGRCLQLCRKQYTINGQKGYWLSAKDLCMAGALKNLAEAGICSFKIEGRMRRSRYVAEVVRVYRKILNDGFKYTKEDKKALDAVYIRGGGTQGFLFDTKNNVMCDITSGHAGALPMDDRVCELKLKIDIECFAYPNKAVRLVLRHGATSIEIDGEVAELSINAPLEEGAINRNLIKTGGTPFEVENISVKTNNAFLALSSLNELRRRGLEELKKEILKGYEVDKSKFVIGSVAVDNISTNFASVQHIERPSYKHIIMVDSIDKFQLTKQNADCVIYAPIIYDKNDIENFIAKASPLPVFLSLPIIARHNDMKILREILLSEKIKNVVANNLYVIELAKNKNIMLGLGLNLINNAFHAFEYCSRILSLEAKGEFLPSDIVYAFGVPSLMSFCHCINKTMGIGCKSCKGSDYTLTDETNADFKIKQTKISNCYHHLYNNIPINAVNILKQKNHKCGLLYDFISFSLKDLKQIDCKNLSTLSSKFTRGHLYRGVE